MGIKIIDLNQAGVLQNTDVFPISQLIAGVQETKKATIQQLTSQLNYIQKPAIANDKNVLTYDQGSSSWVASTTFSSSSGVFIPRPASPSDKNVLTYDQASSSWIASSLFNAGSEIFIPKPSSPTNGQVLTYNTSTSNWEAANPGLKLTDFTGTNQSLSSNGYQKLPGGMIMQWGLAPNGTVTFPITFPNACLVVVACKETSTSYDTVACKNFTVTSFDLLYLNIGQTKNPWIAIGN